MIDVFFANIALAWYPIVHIMIAALVSKQISLWLGKWIQFLLLHKGYTLNYSLLEVGRAPLQLMYLNLDTLWDMGELTSYETEVLKLQWECPSFCASIHAKSTAQWQTPEHQNYETWVREILTLFLVFVWNTQSRALTMCGGVWHSVQLKGTEYVHSTLLKVLWKQRQNTG